MNCEGRWKASGGIRAGRGEPPRVEGDAGARQPAARPDLTTKPRTTCSLGAQRRGGGDADNTVPSRPSRRDRRAAVTLADIDVPCTRGTASSPGGRTPAEREARGCGSIIQGLWLSIPELARTLVVMLGQILTLTIVVILCVAFLTLFERKVIGYMQNRIGPNRVGPRGLFQPFADVIKLLLKEVVIPSSANRFLFIVAPLLSIVPRWRPGP